MFSGNTNVIELYTIMSDFILNFHWSRAVCYYSADAQMTSANVFACFTAGLFELSYCIKQIDFIFCLSVR